MKTNGSNRAALVEITAPTGTATSRPFPRPERGEMVERALPAFLEATERRY